MTIVYPPNNTTEVITSVCKGSGTLASKEVERRPGRYTITTEHYYGTDCNNMSLATQTTEEYETNAELGLYYFYANPHNVGPSGTSTLNWSTWGATSIDINGASIDAGLVTV